MKSVQTISSFIAALSCAGVGNAAPADRPNVIIFLVDDMGWMDSSLYGSTFYKTPAMERLAKSSIRFTNAYSAAPLCSPSRASIMSGQYPVRHGMTSAIGHLAIAENDPLYDYEKVPDTSEFLLPASTKFLAPEQYTLGEAFRDAGYRTGFVGKWHMGLAPQFWPDKQGFEFTFHGSPDPGPPSYFSPYKFRAGNITNGPEGEYITDRATDEALKFIHQPDKRPFFLCVWHWAVHSPWGAKPEMIEYFEKHPDPAGLQKSPIMAALLKSMDESLDRLLDDLEATGLDKNTIIIFTSDNGGVVKINIGDVPATNNSPLRRGKATVFEGGSRVPALFRWPGVTDAGGVSAAIISGVDFYPTLLDICRIPQNPEQIIDGVSIAPALRGGALDRENIYCFFPHNFGADSPAAAWVRQGDWKLIEVFYVADVWPDKFLLYNLKDDISETVNLASQFPERVAIMSAALREHYKLSPVPLIPNPAFAPAKLPVGGWISSTSGELKITNSILQVTGIGIATRGVPRESGALELAWRLRAPQSTEGKFFWSDSQLNTPRYGDERRINFTVAGGVWQNYSVQFESADKLYGLRMDFGASAAVSEIEWIELRRANGEVLQRWTF